MQESAKYLIHADITAEGVVERNDVVGAIFGQTEGLLGDELDLRDLQDASKVGRIDVEIDSEGGQSFGAVTIATNLDKVETAILGAALETIDRVGPCRSAFEVDRIEDVRAAKRREIVERAKGLLAESFDGSFLSSHELVEEVRESIRVEDVTEYKGYPAGPRVVDSDAIIIVEGRADVLTLLRFGVKNAVAVEGTDVPDDIASLTRGRTVTAFLDGDRGGELILRELAQVGDVDYVAFAPESRSVEDLSRHEVMAALREKVPYETVADTSAPHDVAATDGSARPAPPVDENSETPETDPDSPTQPGEPTPTDAETERTGIANYEADSSDTTTHDRESPDETETPTDPENDGMSEPGDSVSQMDSDDQSGPLDSEGGDTGEPETLRGHVREVIEAETGSVRFLDTDFASLEEAPAGEAFDRLRDADPLPAAVVLDGELTQRVLDVAAQRGVEQVVARSAGEFVKRPTDVRVRTADQLRH